MHADSPDWLTWWVGNRPVDPAGATVWDDTTSTIATWRDLHHVDPDQPGLGNAPTDPCERAQWLDAMTATLAQRAWLSDRDPQLAPTVCPALTPVAIHDRISQLDRLFAGAPSDHSRIIDDLVAGHLTTPDPHATLSDARSAQTERDRWILANWPYIVEHHELQRLAEQHDPLAQWPTPIRPTVQAALDKLTARLDPTAPVESRTHAELETAIASLDPGARLRDLTDQLVAVNDRLHQVEAERPTEADPRRAALLAAERQSLKETQQDLRPLVTAERQTVNRRAFTPADHDTLRAAITHRTTTLYQRAISDRPEWLIELLTELDDRGTLGQLRCAQVWRMVINAVAARDLDPSHEPVELDPASGRSTVRSI